MLYKLKDRDTRNKTDRGFVIYDEFKDRYGSEITVQESSIAFEACVWIFCKNPRYKDNEGQGSPHLSPTDAKRLIVALQKFVDDAALEENGGEEQEDEDDE